MGEELFHERGVVSWERSCFMREELFHERGAVSWEICFNKLLIFRAR